MATDSTVSVAEKYNVELKVEAADAELESGSWSTLKSLSRKLDSLGIESRGIEVSGHFVVNWFMKQDIDKGKNFIYSECLKMPEQIDAFGIMEKSGSLPTVSCHRLVLVFSALVFSAWVWEILA